MFGKGKMVLASPSVNCSNIHRRNEPCKTQQPRYVAAFLGLCSCPNGCEGVTGGWGKNERRCSGPVEWLSLAAVMVVPCRQMGQEAEKNI